MASTTHLLSASIAVFLLSISHYSVIKADNTNATFDYSDGPLGPDNWGNLDPSWYACGNGTSQSPIAIKRKDVVKLPDHIIPHFHYKRAPAQLGIHKWHLEVTWLEEAGFVSWNKEEYDLVNLHVHLPSEHVIDYFRYPMEAHIVHKGPNDKILVVAIRYKLGEENKFLAKVLKGLPELNNTNTKQPIGNISMVEVGLDDEYYHYMGSLTTPPCTEGVTWIILKKIHYVSEDQIDQILDANLGNNARPLQLLNGRLVYEHINRLFQTS